MTTLGKKFLLAASSLIFALPALSSPAQALTQGDEVLSPTASCTVGYVHGNTAYSAGHCAHNGDNAYDVNGNHIGYWETSHAKGTQLSNNAVENDNLARSDFAIIRTFDNNGSNVYSGNNFAPDWAIVPGAPICKQGVTTGVTCGIIKERRGNIVNAIGAVAHPGDSGGASWIPGVGYVGHSVITYRYPKGTSSSALKDYTSFLIAR